jgi:hypothetical protein
MPAADMFIHSILELWGMSENLPCIYAPWGQQWFDWCFAQALKRREDFIAVLETVVSAEQAEATKRPAPSITSPPTQRKRQKKNCPFAIAQQRAEMGAESVEVISPDNEIPNLECKIVRLLEACWRYNSVSSVELKCVPIGVFPKAIPSLVELIRDMRFGGRKMTFIGLANTLLDDSHALLIAGALRSQMMLAPGEEQETLEMHQMVFQAETRTELLAAAQRAGVNLLLSEPNGPALRCF